MTNANAKNLIEKIQSLPPDKVAEVADFVDFLRLREHDQSLSRVAARASVPAFEAVWNNAEDEAYDAL